MSRISYASTATSLEKCELDPFPPLKLTTRGSTPRAYEELGLATIGSASARRRWARARARMKARALGPQHNTTLIRELDETVTMVRGSPKEACNLSRVSDGLNSGCASSNISDSLVELETRATYLPACIRMVSHMPNTQNRPFPLAGPVVSAPIVSSHVEFTAA